jgi:hypothetical protein
MTSLEGRTIELEVTEEEIITDRVNRLTTNIGVNA